jgi:Family of unknown function (DUF6338)
LHLDLFASWLGPSLTGRDFGFHSLGPGIVLSAFAILGGLLAGMLMRKDGRLRVLNLGPFRIGRSSLGPIRYDPNPRVWSSFIATEMGAVFRVTLKSGKVIVGQIAEYSSDPNDDVLEIVMSDYSIAPEDTAQLKPADGTSGVLIVRDDIELIERLSHEPLVVIEAPRTRRLPRQ